MKRLVTVTEVEGEGLAGLLGSNVILCCTNYFYAGKLIGVNDHDIQLEEAKIVFETGAWGAETWQSAEALPSKLWYVRIASIESYGEVTK
jgi:hypothetical protein